ncbi:MAG: hypothetical protein PHC86_09575, partial [Eubacteriales bacterium]|nr:hypothetical protein [Eubacteriales bacterium]
LSQTPIDQLVPEAMDYTTTYQYLRASYPARPVQTDLALLARRISRSYQRSISVIKLALVLKVFCDIHLLTFQGLGQDRFRIELASVDQTTRAKLSESPVHHYLSTLGGNT